MRSKTFAAVLMLWACTVLAFVGCDRHGSPDDIVSPRADIQITTLNLTAGSILAPVVGTTSNTTASSADFPQVVARLTIFNGITVQLLDYRVDYFQQDGVTSLGLQPFGGLLTERIDGGAITQLSPTSINPGTNPLVTGTVGTADVTIKVVSDELRSFLAGPDNHFRQFSEDRSDTDDFRGLVIAVITIRGVDLNSNQVTVKARVTVGASINTAPAATTAAGG
jgi:hypothetical protein